MATSVSKESAMPELLIAVPNHRARLVAPALGIILILAAAAGLRAWKLTEWSLWEDEETTLYFSQRPDRPFPSGFPVFFLALNGLFRVTGVSVPAGRILSAAVGVFGVWLVYLFLRKHASRQAALVASLLLAVNLGHIFWSQSIRYYGLVLALELLSAYWFFVGFERTDYRALVLSNVAFMVALLTHFSAVLLAPVFVAYLALVIWSRPAEGSYQRKTYLVFGLPFLLVLAIFAGQILRLRGMMSDWTIPSARDPIHVLVTAVAYFGVPVMALAPLGVWAARQVSLRLRMFLVLLSVVPLLELAVIAQMNVVNVTWYYGIIALGGFVLLAALGLVGLYESGRRRVAWGLGGGSVLYYAAFLVAYYTTMHGDRPRWSEAGAYLRGAAKIDAASQTNPEIFATVPGVVAFYLGVDPAETMGSTLVQRLPSHPPEEAGATDRWYVVEAKAVPEEFQRWFAQQCTLKAKFEAHTGPQDRSVLVYLNKAQLAEAATGPQRAAAKQQSHNQLGESREGPLLDSRHPAESQAADAYPPLKFAYVTQFGSHGDGDGQFQGPFGIHLSSSDEVYVADDLGHRIQVFDRDGRFLRRIGTRGTAPGQFAYLDSVVTDAEGLLFVADTGNNRVQVLNAEGQPLRELRRWGFLRHSFRSPRDLLLTGEGRLIVADWGNHCVRIFGPDFQFLQQIGRQGTGPGQFNHPIALAHDLQRRLYVSDFKNHRIQVFDDRGQFLSVFGELGDREGQFSNPSGLAFDSAGRLYVADSGNHRLQVFAPGGRFLAAYGRFGRAAGEFDKPSDLDTAGDDRLYLVDSGNHRIQVLSVN